MSEGTSSAVSPVAGAQIRPRFFFALTVVMLVVVFLGFAPTFYLAPAFDTPTDEHGMPVYLIIHAVLLTAWYVGLVVQSGLIGRGRREVHKTLGMYGVGLAAGVIITGAVATLLAIPRAAELGTFPRGRLNVLVTSNTLNLLVFMVLVSVAIYNRTKPQVHKRLMLIGSIAIIGPAVGPGRMFGGFLQSLLPDSMVPVPLVFWILLVVPIVVHDVVTSRRVHPATAWGVGAKAASVLITLALVNSGAAAAYVNWLEGL